LLQSVGRGFARLEAQRAQGEIRIGWKQKHGTRFALIAPVIGVDQPFGRTID